MLNVVRHARATHVSMRLAYDEHVLSLSVVDDGTGFDPGVQPDAEPHYGLTTMKERAESVGGSLEIESTRGAGTEVRATIPYA